MPDFSKLRKGAEAIADAQQRAKDRGDGNFKPFTPSVYWTNPEKDKENAERYVLFLNEINDIPQVDLITYIEQEREKANGDKYTTFESAVSRKDPVIGEDEDPMSEEWGANPRETNIAVVVVLDPILEADERGRKRARGFTVRTTEFERRIRDDKGELTTETEVVEAPVVGFVQQSPHNFFNLVSSVDADTAPIESTAVRIKRLDEKTYSVEAEAYLDFDIDLVPLVDGIQNLSYVGNDETLLKQIEEAVDEEGNPDDEAAALLIGAFMLDKYLHELCDKERYDELFDGISKPFRYGKKTKNSSSKNSSTRSSTRERPARRSQRRSAEPEAAEETQAEPEALEEPAEEKAKPAAADAREKKMEELRAKAAKRKAANAAA